MSTKPDTILDNPQQRLVRKTPSLWHNRDYLLLISGQGISAIGSQLSLLAFPLLLFTLTHSAVQAGLMTALRTVPYALFTLPAGALVDRWDRKRLMILCDIGRALALGSVPVAMALGHLTYLQLYLVSLVEGTLFVFFSLAESAGLPHVVAPEQLSEASGRNEVLSSLATLVGPALAPILYGLGRAIPFLVDAISYIVSAISLLWIKTRFQGTRVRGQGIAQNLLIEIKEGMAWLWHHPVIRFLALLTFGLNTPCSGYVLILIVLAQQVHASDVSLGMIFAGGGVGSVIGALVVNPLYRRFGFSKVLITAAWLWAVLWLLYAFAPNALVLGALNALSFIVVPIYMVGQYSYRLATIPDQLQGRVNSVFRLVALSGQPLGIALTGLLLQAFGPIAAIFILFVPQIILAMMASFNTHLRQVR